MSRPLDLGALCQIAPSLKIALSKRGETLLASADVIGWADRVSAPSSGLKWVAGGLIIGAVSFNAILCFLSTRGVAISDVHVMMSEALLISGALLVCRNYLSLVHISIIALVLVYTVALSVLREANVPVGGLDVKISRDLFIPIAFFLLGKAVGDLKTADTVVFTATAFVLIFALFEYFFLDTFLDVFNVAEYYIARGTVEVSDSALGISQGLMTSGFRPADQGRTLLWFLGDHRVSSIFLEPITLGNFGTLTTLWAVVRSRMEGRLYVWSALGGLTMLVLSDGRFDAAFLLIGTIMLLIPPRITSILAIPLPFIVMVALYLLGAPGDPFGRAPYLEGGSVYDRLLYCGRVLNDFDAYNWFGLEASRAPTFDAGYAYVISGVGIIGFAAIWLLFMSIPGSSRYYFSFRNVMAVYFALLLCISNSAFTIKIAAPLWFLLGALSGFQIQPQSSSRAEKFPQEAAGFRTLRPHRQDLV